MNRYFLLGIGAQKTGTSWLYRNLKKHHQFDFGITKEYHIWDTIFLKSCSNFIVKNSSQLSELQKIRKNMIEVNGYYEEYFLSKINKKINITGDMTPSYSMLNKNHFEMIKKKILDSKFNIKVILILRDPIERVWSQMKMERKFAINKGLKFSTSDLFLKFERDHCENNYFERSNYINTLKVLEIFEKDEILVLFYENLFCDNSTKKISDFFNIQNIDLNFSKKINSSEDISLPNYLRKLAMNKYSKIIEHTILLFPQSKEYWNY